MLKRVEMFLVGLFFIVPSALTLIIVVHIVKFFHNIGREKSTEQVDKVVVQSSAINRFSDPFHNSRQHPLNSPEAPRG